MQPPKSSWKKWASLGARIAVTVCLVGYVLTRIEWQDSLRIDEDGKPRTVYGTLATVDGRQVLKVGELSYEIPPAPKDPKEAPKFAPGFLRLLGNVNKPLLGLAVVMLAVSFSILALRWQWLLRTHALDPGFFETLRLTWVGLVANNVLPSSIGGDAVKALCISRRSPGKRMASVMTVLMDRVLGLVALLGVGGVGLLLQAARPELEQIRQTLLLVLGLLVIGLFVFFSGRVRELLRVQHLLARMPMGHHLQTLDQAVFHYRAWPRTMLAAIAISVALHVCTVTCMCIMGTALGMRAGFVHYLSFVPLIFTMGAFVPSIGGLGVLEGAFAYFFSLPFVGDRASSAVALCLLYRMVQILVTLPGLYWFQAELAAHKKHAHAAESVEEPAPKLGAGSAVLSV